MLLKLSVECSYFPSLCWTVDWLTESKGNPDAEQLERWTSLSNVTTIATQKNKTRLTPGLDVSELEVTLFLLLWWLDQVEVKFPGLFLINECLRIRSTTAFVLFAGRN
jgi:hypothetical protein